MIIIHDGDDDDIDDDYEDDVDGEHFKMFD